jgi:hypothetical protein
MLINTLPQFYEKSLLMKNIQQALQNKIDIKNLEVIDFINQLNIDTATWALNLYEEELGIQTDESKSYEFRREKIKSKIRGPSTASKFLIKVVAESFSTAKAEILEEPENFRFMIIFLSSSGLPANKQDIEEVLEELKPAHLYYILGIELLKILQCNYREAYYKFSYIPCGTILCGTTPIQSTLGNINEQKINITQELNKFKFEYIPTGTILAGTFPILSTLGAINVSTIELQPDVENYKFDYIPCGTKP